MRATLPGVLNMGGFDVTVYLGVPEALAKITRRSFDILLTDLNLGEQGDGFTLVSAMRRVPPRAATVIITGFPQFESALNAIKEQVDEYIVKPSHPTTLMSRLRSVLETRPLRQQAPLVRIFDVLRENKELVSKLWLVEVEADPMRANSACLNQTGWPICHKCSTL